MHIYISWGSQTYLFLAIFLSYTAGFHSKFSPPKDVYSKCAVCVMNYLIGMCRAHPNHVVHALKMEQSLG